jgi:UDP-glucose 4-epimerase
MRILVTGGAGFIGSALVKRLARNGNSVVVLDDLSNGDVSRLPPEVEFHEGDVRDVPLLWTLLRNVDCVYHLAARVSVPESVLYPREYNDVNVGGTVALMEAMRTVGVKRVVLTSSGTLYGEQPTQPLQESMWPNPTVPYAVSKIAAEHYLFTLGRLYGITTVALRIFNAYGPGQPIPSSHPPVIPYFLKQITHGGSLVVFGDGEQTRDFVYVEDVVRALVEAGKRANVDRAVINIGSGQETSLNDLVKLIEEATGREADVLYNREKSGGVRRMVADITLARKLLGYNPKYDLSSGLKKMLKEDPRFHG